MMSKIDPNLKKKMEGEEEVKLLGFWVSAFSDRVIWALELKGIDYRYIEEDINKKSQLLLDANPVHKKVPVLFHRGRAIAESIVILEYIEETWPEKKPLMPDDPYQRALARFWIKFGEDHMIPIFGSSLITIEEEQEKAAEEARELLRFLEENCLGNKKFFGGDAVGIMDLAFGWLAYCIEPTEAAAGVKLMDRHALPRMCAWTDAFKEVSVIKRNIPDYDKLVTYLVLLREKKLVKA